jgi:hypothetical protein
MTSPPHRVAFYADIVYDHPLSGPYWVPPANLDAEAIILGGDIHCTPEHLAAMLREIRAMQHPDMHIVVIPGNGEYIGFELAEARARYRGAVEAHPNTAFLDDDAITLPSGLRIIGSTLWSRIADEDLATYQHYLTDAGETGVDNVRLGERPLTFEDTNELHRRAVTFLRSQLEALSARERERTIVCSHHWPTLAPWIDAHGTVTMDRYQSAATDLDDLIIACGPKLWLCGHVHETKDVMIGNTRIVSNPWTGHAGSRVPNINPEFDSHFIAELPRLSPAQHEDVRR